MVKIIEYNKFLQLQKNIYTVEIQAEVDGMLCDFFYSSTSSNKLNDATADFLRSIADTLSKFEK